MDEFKHSREEDVNIKAASDKESKKPHGEQRQKRHGKIKNGRAKNNKAQDQKESKHDTDSKNGKDAANIQNNSQGKHKNSSHYDRSGEQNKSQRPEHKEKKPKAKQNENRAKKGRSIQISSEEDIPPNVIDDGSPIFLTEYLPFPHKKSKISEQLLPEPEVEEVVPGAYKFPDDTGQIVFGDPPEEKPKPQPEQPVEMVEIVDVRFKLSGKTYFFSPNGLTLQKDDKVIVETARGLEFGTVVLGNRYVPVTQIVPPLKNVLRIATPEDIERKRINEEKEIEAFNICLQKIEEHGLDMKLIDAEYTFDNSKLLFYFTADGRVDFRELARDLASIFRTRIELRQIGIRDEAKMLGGIGICGRPICCTTFLSEFGQVSIKMAKEQNLSLNSSKISGLCGRLMCCLRYEYGTYVEELAKTPRVNTLVETPDGIGVVTEISPLAGLVKVLLEDNPDQPPRYYNRADLKQIAPPPSEDGKADEEGDKDELADDVDFVPDEDSSGVVDSEESPPLLCKGQADDI